MVESTAGGRFLPVGAERALSEHIRQLDRFGGQISKLEPAGHPAVARGKYRAPLFTV
jgi:hypothetical protein